MLYFNQLFGKTTKTVRNKQGSKNDDYIEASVQNYTTLLTRLYSLLKTSVVS